MLPLASPAEVDGHSPGGEDESVAKEDRAGGLRAFVTQRFGFNVAGPRVDDANLFVLTRRHQLGAVPVEARAQDDVGMAIHVEQHLAGPHIPDDDLVVGAGGQEDVQGRRMPEDKADASLMIKQIDDRLVESPR